MKGKFQNAFLNSLIEQNLKITHHHNLSIHMKSYTDVIILKILVKQFPLFFLPNSPILLMVFKEFHIISHLYLILTTPFLLLVAYNTNDFFLSKGQQTRYSHLTTPHLIYVQIYLVSILYSVWAEIVSFLQNILASHKNWQLNEM